MRLDYLIVGQGIAGTVLAHSLLQAGKLVKVIDEPRLSTASKIAAGLFNPIVFKRTVKSWMADELLPFAKNFYQEAEKKYGVQFYTEREILKVFVEEKEEKLWKEKMAGPEEKYLGTPTRENTFPEHLQEGFGYAPVQHAGNVKIKVFLDAFRAFLKENDLLIEEKFDHAKLKTEEQITYGDLEATRIIFCEGHKTTENPLFSWLPFKLTKGELLTIRMEGLKTDQVFNKGVFVLPAGEDLYKVGATYEWEELDEIPTNKGKQELIEKLEKLIKAPYEIVDHRAGVRPTVVDRRPILGAHPELENVVVFNGMGTKGVMLAPYFANHLVEHLEEGKDLLPEVAIQRCKKYLSP